VSIEQPNARCICLSLGVQWSNCWSTNSWPFINHVTSKDTDFKGLSSIADVWLSKWEDGQANLTNSELQKNSLSKLSVYGGIGGAQAVFAVLVSITLALGSLIASRKYHSALLKKIFYAPMSFFDTTPLGNVLNRNQGFKGHKRSLGLSEVIKDHQRSPEAFMFISQPKISLTWSWTGQKLVYHVMLNEPLNRIGNDIFNIDSTIPNAMGLLINLLFMTIANIIVIIYAIWQFILATVFIPPLIGWKIANENRKKSVCAGISDLCGCTAFLCGVFSAATTNWIKIESSNLLKFPRNYTGKDSKLWTWP